MWADSNLLKTSTNKTSWTTRLTASGRILDLSYANGVFIAVTDSTIYRSTNGTSWSQVGSIDGGGGYSHICYLQDNIWIIIGLYEVKRSTNNGSSWQTVTKPSGLRSVANGIVVHNQGVTTFTLTGFRPVYISTDLGVSWIEVTPSTTKFPKFLYYSEGMYHLIYDGEDVIYTSTNLTSWSSTYFRFPSSAASTALSVSKVNDFIFVTERGSRHLFFCSGGSRWGSVYVTASSMYYTFITENDFVAYASNLAEDIY